MTQHQASSTASWIKWLIAALIPVVLAIAGWVSAQSSRIDDGALINARQDAEIKALQASDSDTRDLLKEIRLDVKSLLTKVNDRVTP